MSSSFDSPLTVSTTGFRGSSKTAVLQSIARYGFQHVRELDGSSTDYLIVADLNEASHKLSLALQYGRVTVVSLEEFHRIGEEKIKQREIIQIPRNRCRSCFRLCPIDSLFVHPNLASFLPEPSVCLTCYDIVNKPALNDSHSAEMFCQCCGEGEIARFKCDGKKGKLVGPSGALSQQQSWNVCNRSWCEGCLRANLGCDQFSVMWSLADGQQWPCPYCSQSYPNEFLPQLDLHCRAERGGFSERTVFSLTELSSPLVAGHTYHSPAALPTEFRSNLAPLLHPSPSPSLPVPPLKRVISCCLYRRFETLPSTHCKYIYGLYRNLKQFETVWPGWKLRIYYDTSLTKPFPDFPDDETGNEQEDSNVIIWAPHRGLNLLLLLTRNSKHYDY
jgi:hypothetical protein